MVTIGYYYPHNDCVPRHSKVIWFEDVFAQVRVSKMNALLVTPPPHHTTLLYTRLISRNGHIKEIEVT
jgi:hypothetical protein